MFKIKTILLSSFVLFVMGCSSGDSAEYVLDQQEDEVGSGDVGDIVEESAKMIFRNNEIRQKVYLGSLIAWDAGLALSAQKHATTLALTNTFEHSQNEYGENLYASTGVATFSDAIDSWYEEKQHYDHDNYTCAEGQICGHYTQLIWEDTTEVGCGKASSADFKTIIVCQYNPPGNIIGEQAY